MVNKAFKIISPSLRIKFYADAFIIKREGDKVYTVELLVKVKEKGYNVKPFGSIRRIKKEYLEEYIKSDFIREIQFIFNEN